MVIFAERPHLSSPHSFQTKAFIDIKKTLLFQNNASACYWYALISQESGFFIFKTVYCLAMGRTGLPLLEQLGCPSLRQINCLVSSELVDERIILVSLLHPTDAFSTFLQTKLEVRKWFFAFWQRTASSQLPESQWKSLAVTDKKKVTAGIPSIHQRIPTKGSVDWMPTPPRNLGEHTKRNLKLLYFKNVLFCAWDVTPVCNVFVWKSGCYLLYNLILNAINFHQSRKGHRYTFFFFSLNLVLIGFPGPYSSRKIWSSFFSSEKVVRLGPILAPLCWDLGKFRLSNLDARCPWVSPTLFCGHFLEMSLALQCSHIIARLTHR